MRACVRTGAGEALPLSVVQGLCEQRRGVAVEVGWVYWGWRVRWGGRLGGGMAVWGEGEVCGGAL